MSLLDWLTVAVTVGLSSLCSEYAKDFKRYMDRKLKEWTHKV